MSKLVLCTNCGSTTHGLRGCMDATVHYKPGIVVPGSKVAGPMVRCMSCNKYGHVMCKPLPEIPESTAGCVICCVVCMLCCAFVTPIVFYLFYFILF
jgi:hypothetical protein